MNWVFLISAEDLILNKLLWFKASESERQLSDVRGILENQKDNLDLNHLKKWAFKLKIADLLLPF